MLDSRLIGMRTFSIFKISFFLNNFRVLVMADGEILEFDEPNLLIQNTNSHFYHLASQEFSDKE